MLAECADYSDCGPELALIVGIYAGLGAAIGVGIDALMPGKKVVVYQPAGKGAGASLTLSPVLGPERQGIAATLRF